LSRIETEESPDDNPAGKNIVRTLINELNPGNMVSGVEEAQIDEALKHIRDWCHEELILIQSQRAKPKAKIESDAKNEDEQSAGKSSHSFFTPQTKKVAIGVAINTTAVAAALGVMGLMISSGPGSAALTATAVTIAGASVSTGGLALVIGLGVLGAIGTGFIIKGIYDNHQRNKNLVMTYP